VENSLVFFPGKIYALSTHWHPDHFSKHILAWKEVRPDIEFIFSKDILKKKLASPDEAIYLKKGDIYQDNNIYIKAFGSTDVGISFLIETEGKRIFHAGDLNNWHWDEESTPEEIQKAERQYLRELKTIAREVNSLDLAMFPVDCQLGKNYMRGAEQFVAAVPTALFSPMHFGATYQQANAFRTYAENAGCRFVAWSKTGESIVF
jgi:L-ascorbate metabolism protein UlaG (beta-lactamase superfamily)